VQLTHGETFVAIGSALSDLRRPAEAAPKTRQGLAILRKLADRGQGATAALNRIAEAFLSARPAEFQDPRLALTYVERSLASHGAEPATALLKARALRRLGREPEALATAAAALAALPPPDPQRKNTYASVRRKIETFLTAP
jgi:tetratricopeptide (TPR) repeat protein